jgi:hypothetical protein
MKARFEFPSHLYDPLSITALYGTDGMLRDLLNSADLRSCNYPPISAIAAVDQVSQWGDRARLRVRLTELISIAAHAGSRPIFQRLFSVAERHANLASELSFVTKPSLVRDLMAALQVDKAMFRIWGIRFLHFNDS